MKPLPVLPGTVIFPDDVLVASKTRLFVPSAFIVAFELLPLPTRMLLLVWGIRLISVEDILICPVVELLVSRIRFGVPDVLSDFIVASLVPVPTIIFPVNAGAKNISPLLPCSRVILL